MMATSALSLYMLTGIGIVSAGLIGLCLSHDAIRRLVAVNLMGSGTFLVMVALAGRQSPPDSILHAWVVTGLVVAVSATAFALRLITASALAEQHRRAADSNTAQEPQD